MRGRSPAEAVNRYKELMQRTVSCVSGTVLTVGGGYYVAASPHQIQIGEGEPVPLMGERPFRLELIQHYRIVPAGAAHRIEVVAYVYTLLNEDRRQLLAYHWHPDGSSRVWEPHLHLGPWSAAELEGLSKAHLPTGRIGLPAFVRMLIEEFAVPPLCETWGEILAEIDAEIDSAACRD